MFLTLGTVPSLEMGSCAFHKDLVSGLDEVQGIAALVDGHPFRLHHTRILSRYLKVFFF